MHILFPLCLQHTLLGSVEATFPIRVRQDWSPRPWLQAPVQALRERGTRQEFITPIRLIDDDVASILLFLTPVHHCRIAVLLPFVQFLETFPEVPSPHLCHHQLLSDDVGMRMIWVNFGLPLWWGCCSSQILHRWLVCSASRK